ncbi:MAG TPA: hypothetical protein VFQ53_06455 [Kofleriaceae bacterium]|nr:hypothetical protein [Kofleriaceae bacterium]
MQLRGVAIALALVGCAGPRPRFASPMLGTAQLPPEPLGRPRTRDALPPEDGHVPVERRASAAAATAIASTPVATVRDQLPAPHRQPPESRPPPVRTPDELRALVGRRDARSSLDAAIAWTTELGGHVDGTTGRDLAAWAEREHRMTSDPPGPGDLVLFDRATSDDAFDLAGIVVVRDARGVVEFVYVGGGVVRRGYFDPARPAQRRDGSGAIVNTYLRHGKRQPPSGTRYLAGELVSRVIRTR